MYYRFIVLFWIINIVSMDSNIETKLDVLRYVAELARSYEHAIEKKLFCNICDFCCESKDILKNHIRFHTGLPVFICNFCQRPYIQAGTLHLHLQTHLPAKIEPGKEPLYFIK